MAKISIVVIIPKLYCLPLLALCLRLQPKTMLALTSIKQLPSLKATVLKSNVFILIVNWLVFRSQASSGIISLSLDWPLKTAFPLSGKCWIAINIEPGQNVKLCSGQSSQGYFSVSLFSGAAYWISFLTRFPQKILVIRIPCVVGQHGVKLAMPAQ